MILFKFITRCALAASVVFFILQMDHYFSKIWVYFSQTKN